MQTAVSKKRSVFKGKGMKGLKFLKNDYNCGHISHFFHVAAFAAFLLFIGVGNALSSTATITKRSNSDSDWSNIKNGDTSDAYITWKGNDDGQHVAFTLSGGKFEYYQRVLWRDYYYFRANNNQDLIVDWTVDDGYTVCVTNVTINTRASLNGTATVGTNTNNTSIYHEDDTFESRSSGAIQKGNDESVGITFRNTSVLSNDKINFFIHTLTVTYTIGSNYKVRFNANGASGSMADQDFVYGVSQALRSNTFTPTNYTVTFDANGGYCGMSSATPEHSFAGWATSENGAVVYTNGQTVSNLTEDVNGIVQLYAKWSGGSFALPAIEPAAGYLFAGWYDENENFIGNVGDPYTPMADITLKAHWNSMTSMTIGDVNKDGDLVVTTPHAIFTLHSEDYGITDYKSGYGFYVWKPLARNTTKDVTLSWEKTKKDGNYSIQVTHISFKAKAYNSNAFVVSKGKISFNGGDAFSIGTASLDTDGGWSSTIGGDGSYTSGVVTQLINTSNVSWETFDYHFKDFLIKFTIIPDAPSSTNANLDATLSELDKQTLNLNTLFSLSNPADDFEYVYRLAEDYDGHAHIEIIGGDTVFWADAKGDYEVQCCVATGDDHEASAWSTATIHVTRTCVFHNNYPTGDKDWHQTANWMYGVKPDATDAVRVIGDLLIDESINVLSLSIEDTAVVTIAPQGGLTVGVGGITGSTTSNLILKAGTSGDVKGQTGYLRISPDCELAMPSAIVELYNTTYLNTGTNVATYQCLGAPIEGVKANMVFPTGTYLYTWDEANDKWVSARTKLTFEAFQGYEITQRKVVEGFGLEYAGQLISGKTVITIDLDHTDGHGYNLLANSFAAPISIEEFESTDFTNADETIYILNAGTKVESHNQLGDLNAPGKWIGVPIETASALAAAGYPTIIPSMQGFWIKTSDEGAQIKLDYSRLVWGVDYSGVKTNKPLRIQKSHENEEPTPTVGLLQVSVSSEQESDFVFLLESENYDAAYQNGYDARKIPSGSLDIFTIEGEEHLGVDATHSIVGTRLGVHTGEETAYTFTFSHVAEREDLALLDAEANQTIDIYDGTTYTFFAEPNSDLTERFLIVERAETPTITTGVDNSTQTTTNVQKFVKNGQLFLLKNGVLYNATGVRVK